MAEIYARKPDGSVVAIDEADQQAAANAGYQPLEPEELKAAQRAAVSAVPREEAVRQGLLEAKPFAPGVDTTTGLSGESEAFLNTVKSGLTFGQLPSLHTPEAVASGRRFAEEHPGQAMAGAALGQTPLMLAGGAAGAALGTAAEGAGLLARGAAAAADLGGNAAIAGAQIEGEDARLAARDFSYTDAALAGATAEVLGRGSGWVISKALGGARNLVAGAARKAVADDAERSLTKGGWVGDYRVAQHADEYHTQLAGLAANDLDTLETATAEVSRQDRKRSRIMASVVDNPPVQRPIAVEASENLQRLRSALADELPTSGGGPAARLAKQLDDRIAALEQAPQGKKLWRLLDENRQALQEYRQDLHQAYDSNPGSAWLSRDGLAAIDSAEEHTRNALLREDAWGESAARMQREYNTPFHEKWFPSRQTALKGLYFATGKDAQGFTTFRGEPSKVLAFLKSAPEDVDKSRLREMFGQYLDGAAAIAKAGQADSPAAARDTLESVRRLRKAMANAEYITQAAANTARRAGYVDAATLATGVVAGGALGGAGPAAIVAATGRSARVGTWLSRVGRELGWFSGKPASMAELLAKGALPEVGAVEPLGERLVRDFAEAPFPPAESVRPGAPQGPLQGAPTRAVGVDLPPAPEALPGVGQARRAAADRPAGLEAIQPAPRPIDVGPPEPSVPPGESRFGTMAEGASSGPVSEAAPPDAAAALAETRPTHPAPFRTEGMAWESGLLAGGADARAAEAARMHALTEGEFASVVKSLRTADARTPEGESLADLLTKNAETLKSAGLIVAGAGGLAYQATHPDDSGAAAASVGGLAAVLGASRLIGARWLGKFAGSELEAAAEAVPFVRKRAAQLKPPPPVEPPVSGVNRYSWKHEPNALSDLADRSRKVYERDLTDEERNAVDAWIGSSTQIRREQNTGLTGWEHVKTKSAENVTPLAPAFESATEKLTVANPTKHGFLYRRMELTNEQLAELLDPEQNRFVAGAHLSTSYFPSDAFGPHEFRFHRVDAAASLLGANPDEVEMVIPQDARFNITRRYYDPHKNRFVFTLEEVPDTRAERAKDLTHPPGFLTPAATVAGAGLGAAADSGSTQDPNAPATAGLSGGAALGAAAGLGAAALFGQRAAVMKLARSRLVADVAKRLFSATYEPTAKLVARAAVASYSRSDLAARKSEIHAWAENPQELVDRVAEGFRDAPPEQFADASAAVYKTATFLKERLPGAAQTNAVALRQIPVSREAASKFARYEDAALRPKEALQAGAAAGHLSPELLETMETLYPDLLAEVRVQAYQTVREDGPPPTVQSRVAYGRLFGGDGSLADAALSPTASAMVKLAYDAAPAQKNAPPRAGVSAVSQAVTSPAGLGSRA